MTTTAPGHGAVTAVPRFADAGAFLEGLAIQDLGQIGGALSVGARLRTLLPSGRREWPGTGAVAGRFGDTEDFELGPRPPSPRPAVFLLGPRPGQPG